MVLIYKIWILFTQGWFVLGLLEIDSTLLEKKTIYFYYFPIISPWDRAWSFIWTYFYTLYQWILRAKFGWNGIVVLEKIKMWKVYRHTDERTDDGRQAIRKAHLNFHVTWDKKRNKLINMNYGIKNAKLKHWYNILN